MRTPVWRVGIATNVLVSVVAITLVCLSGPRLISAFMALPVDATRFNITYNNSVSNVGLLHLIESRQSALAWVEDPSHYRDIGIAALRLAERRGRQSADGQRLLELGELALINGLRIAPANAYAWMNLARVRHFLGRDPDDVMLAY